MPTSAAASAGASLMPSPTIATMPPGGSPCCSSARIAAITAALSPGSTSARTSVMPSCRATASAAPRLSPLISTVRRPTACSAWIAAAAPGLGSSPKAIRPRTTQPLALGLRAATTRCGPGPAGRRPAAVSRPSFCGPAAAGQAQAAAVDPAFDAAPGFGAQAARRRAPTGPLCPPRWPPHAPAGVRCRPAAPRRRPAARRRRRPARAARRPRAAGLRSACRSCRRRPPAPGAGGPAPAGRAPARRVAPPGRCPPSAPPAWPGPARRGRRSPAPTRRGSWPPPSRLPSPQARPVSSAMTTTTGTKTALMRSTSCCIGAFWACALATSRTMRASCVSAPTAVVRTTMRPSPLSAPPVTASPGSRATGRLSPVSSDSSRCVRPSISTPSLGTRSPGSTTTSSPIAQLAQRDWRFRAAAPHPGGVGPQLTQGVERAPGSGAWRVPPATCPAAPG